MFRLPPSRIALSSEDVAQADFTNRVDPSATIAASQALNVALQSPNLANQTPTVESASSNSTAPAATLLPSADLASDTNNNNNNMATDPAVDALLPPVQLPYAHLAYGPEREAIFTSTLENLHINLHKHMKAQLAAQSASFDLTLAQLHVTHDNAMVQALDNLHISYHQHMKAQLAEQSANSALTLAQLGTMHDSDMAQLRATHQQTLDHLTLDHLTLDHLTAELSITRLQNQIYNWRQGVSSSSSPSNNNNDAEEDPNQATDLLLLLAKFADLRSGPISALAGVQTAESASEPGMDVVGEDVVAVAAADAPVGRLYGAEEDVRAVLAAEGEEISGGGADAHSGTVGGCLGEEEGEEGPEGGVGVNVGEGWAAVGCAFGELRGEGHDEGGRADAGRALNYRRGLLGRLKKILKKIS
jgi:hypothetical protein